MKVKPTYIIIFLIISMVAYCLCAVKNANENQDVVCLAIVDGSISSGLQFDLNKMWTNHNDPPNFKDDDANGLVDDTVG